MGSLEKWQGWKSHLAVDRRGPEAELLDIGHEGSLQDASQVLIGVTAGGGGGDAANAGDGIVVISCVLDSLLVGNHRAVVWGSCGGQREIQTQIRH